MSARRLMPVRASVVAVALAVAALVACDDEDAAAPAPGATLPPPSDAGAAEPECDADPSGTNGAPLLDNLTPDVAGPGGVVALEGADLDATRWPLVVTIGGVVAKPIPDWDDGTIANQPGRQLWVEVPATLAPGAARVVVTWGTCASWEWEYGFTVDEAPAPRVTGFTPTHGPNGSTIIVTGEHLEGVTLGGLGASQGSCDVIDDATIACPVGSTLPAGAYRVYVHAPSGAARSEAVFTVDP